MKIQMMVKQASIRLMSGLAATVFLWTNSALAQTPVSTSVHLSGSCAKCDLSRRVMPGMSLQGANFSGSDFSHSNLAGANFNQANLDNTSFYKAYLMQVKGERVNLNKSVLRGTTLSDVSLVSSNFVLADLQKADLTGGDFTHSDFTKARLKSADAMGTIFIGANFTKAKLDHGDFTGSDFSGAQFIHTKFGDAIVTGANFTGANFSGAEMVELTGLIQGQLDVACGSAETLLPEGMSIRVCPPQTELVTETDTAIEAETIVVDLKPEPMSLTDRIVPQGSPTPIRPMMATRIPRRGTMMSIRSTDLDEIMRGIDGALGDMPMSNPNRARLEQSKRKLKAVQLQAGNR